MAQIFNEDARKIADMLEPESVQCVVTSPPYWGLRDYGLEPSVWGGDPGCEHEWVSERVYSDKITRKASSERWTRADGTTANADALKAARWKEDTRCSKCGAWRGCLGLETSPEQFVANIVEVFRAVWKVLRPDGTLWLNLGDSYNGSGGAGGDYNSGGLKEGQPRYPGRRVAGLKPKDLCMIPARVALALQADGWYLRSAIVWAKGMSFCPDYAGSVMPESVRDRPTSAYEMVYLLTKSERYFYDADAVAEPSLTQDPRRPYTSQGAKQLDGRTVWHSGELRNGTDFSKRNLRNVWAINLKPYPEAHFATFPEKLVEPCILAGSKPGDVVLDPFAGSGTTLAVAERLQRDAIGFELNPEYIKLIEKRLSGLQLQMAF